MVFRKFVSSVLLLAWLLPCAALAQVNVAAASDLKFALPEVATAFERRGGEKLQISFGSSGNFRRQIAEGAPFELFFSADEAYADALIAEGRAQAPGLLYGIGRIVLFLPKGSPLKADAALKDLAAAATDGRLAKLAIANPEHAPYGVAAQQALRAGYLWDRVASKMVYAENVRQALQWAQDGQADAAIVALSLAVVTEGGRTLPIDPALHAPLDQALAVCGKGKAAADGARFVEFMSSPEGREVMKRYGFILPGE